MLNTSNWIPFSLEKIFERIEPTKGTTTDALSVGNEIPYICASKKNNGFDYMAARDGNEQFISKGNCIVLIQIGAGGAGYATYQDVDFIGMAGKTIACYTNHLNKERGLFLATLLSQERFRYCYGRSWTGERLNSTKIKLPISSHGDIDWEWIDSYMHACMQSIPTSKNLSKNDKVDTSKWKLFKISQFLHLTTGKVNSAIDLPEGDEIFYLGAKKDSNGIMGKVARVDKLISRGNCLVFICDGQGSVGYVNYMDKDFIGTVNLTLGYSEHLNPYVGTFIATVASLERPRYSYGRKWRGKVATTTIQLPTTEQGEPDWQYMENYIKSLPYGDCI